MIGRTVLALACLVMIVGCDTLPSERVAQLPDLVATLSRAKTMCENHVRSAKAEPAILPAKKRRLAQGQQLYAAAQADFNAYIEALNTAFGTRFQGVNLDSLEGRRTQANSAIATFLQWNTQQARIADGKASEDDGMAHSPAAAAPVIMDLLLGLNEAVLGWAKHIESIESGRIDRARSDILRQKLSAWDEI